tara:strand:+ start:523 stop:693 length:171 start_codon:yes stop_codon:yes gene_type:complete
MAVVETVKLRPAAGVSDADFLAASDRFEQTYMCHLTLLDPATFEMKRFAVAKVLTT